jgi:hypothetical protein
MGLEGFRRPLPEMGNWMRSRRMRAWTMYPLFVLLLMVRTRCSTPIRMSLYLIDGRPNPCALSGLCIPSVGKLSNRPMAWRMALFSMMSMAVSCRSLSTRRYVAWYLNFRRCSTARVLYGGLSFLFCLGLWLICGRPWQCS